MSRHPILRWPDPILAEACVAVDHITPEITKLCDDMLETMYAAPGRGLAAPQVGVLLRIFVMDTEWKDGDKAPLVFINPKVIDRSDRLAVHAEGCLSIPGVSADISRPDAVTLQWSDLAGRPHERVFTGFAAACVQHEVDHLDGIVTLDRLDPDSRARVLTNYDRVPA